MRHLEPDGGPGEHDEQSLLVAARESGMAALVRAETGRLTWNRRTRRELGTLIHGGGIVYLPLGAPLRLHARRRRARTAGERHRIEARLSAPAHLEARRAHDGGLVWVFADWDLAGALRVVIEGDTLIAASTTAYSSRLIFALDARTGRLRWHTLPTADLSFIEPALPSEVGPTGALTGARE